MQEIQNHAVNTLFNLCRLSSERQSEAAAAGAIPLLQRIVRDNSPLKQFALPILCDFAHAGKATRKLCVFLCLPFPPFCFLLPHLKARDETDSDDLRARAYRLWHHDGLAFYLVLLRDTFWVNYALEAILAWCVLSCPFHPSPGANSCHRRLQDEPARVEECLLEPSAIEALVDLFCKTKSTVFDNFLDPLHKVRLTRSLLSVPLCDDD